MFLVTFFDLQNFILLVPTVPFLRKIFFINSYTAKNNYFLLYELIQDLPYHPIRERNIYIIFPICFCQRETFSFFYKLDRFEIQFLSLLKVIKQFSCVIMQHKFDEF